MKYDHLIELIEQIAPTGRYLDIDNSGIQVRNGKDEINCVLVCLEMNDEIIREAAEKGADMIITHHPLLFRPVGKIVPEEPVGRYLLALIREGIDVYSSHLPFDASPCGNNMYLADLLGLEVPEFSRPGAACGEEEGEEGAYRYDDYDIGTIGTLPRGMSFEEFERHVETSLDLPQGYVRCVDGGCDEIRKVAFCTGSGGDFVFTAVREGCDAYVTGDLKLHEAQYAKACGLTVIDAGHYGTEKIFTENMAARLRERAGDALQVLEAEANTNPYTL